MSTMIDYMQLCRLCLVKEKVNVPIFGDTTDVRQIYLKIAACLPVKVTQEDNLPKKICDACLYKVDLLYQFWNTSVNAEKQLIQWLTEIGVDVNIKNSDIATQPLPILPQSHAHPHSMPSETLMLKQERPDMIDGQPPVYPLQNQQGLYPAYDNLGYPQPEVSMEVGNAARFENSSEIAKIEEPVEEPPAPTPKKRGRPPAANKKTPPKRKAPEEVIPARTPATKRRSSAAAAAAAVAAAAAAASDSEDDSDIDDRLEGLGGDDDSDDDDDDGRVAKEEVDSDSDYVEPTAFVGVPSDPNQDGEQPGPSGLSGVPGKAGATGTNAATESGKKEDQKDSPSYVVVGYVPLSCLSGEPSPLIDLKSSKENFVFVQSPDGTGKRQIPPNIPITKPIIFLKSLKSNIKVVPSSVKTLSQHSASNTENEPTVTTLIKALPQHAAPSTQKKPTMLFGSKLVKIVPSPNRGRLQHITRDTQNETTNTASVMIVSKPNVKMVKPSNTAVSQEPAPSNQIKRSKPKKKIVRSRITTAKPQVISKLTFRDTRPSKCFCPACGQYIAETFLRTHIEAHDDEFDFFCRFCLSGFNSTKDRDAHIENEHNNFRYLCFPCNRSFHSRLYYMDHMDTHLPDPPVREFTCIKCFAVCNTRKELRLHYRKHITYECDECGRVLASNDLLNDHKLRHRGIKPVMCEECGRRFTNYKVLDSHRKTVHAVNRPHVCKTCNKAYKTAIGLRTHVATHSSLRPFQCDICENAFKTKATLYTHKLKHNDTRPFSCSSCDKRFTTEMHLTTHLLTQGPDHNKTRFTCILCDQDFTSKFGLNGHMRTKHDVFTEGTSSTLKKKYSCDICGKILANVTNLTDHRRIHTGERPFSCKICNKGFSSKRLLHEHRLVHSLDKPYSCDICDKSFKSKPSLKKHLVCHKK